MKNKLMLGFGLLAYLASFFLIIYYIIIEFSIINIYSPLYRVATVFVIIIFMYIGGVLLKSVDNNRVNKIYKLNLYIWFILWIIMILNLTLFDKYFNRHYNYKEFSHYIKNSFNIVPLSTISNYFVALRNDNLRKITFFYNIFGNVLAFIPLSLFVPRIFKIINKWYKYFIVSSIFIIFIEVMQMIMRCGSCDIDDYILNILGTMIFYFVFNNKFIKNKIDKYMFLKEVL